MHKKQGISDREPLDLLDDVLVRARRAGAENADAVLAEQHSLAVTYRLGKRESLDRAESATLGLRVFIGHKQAIVATSDFSLAAISELIERAVAMARIVPDDPFCGLAEASAIATDEPDLDSCEAAEPDVEAVSRRAATAEAAALAVDGITNSEGAEASSGIDRFAIAASNGLARRYARSWHGVSVSVLAGSGTAMERDYEYAQAVYQCDLDDPAAVGRRCGERTVRRLHPRKVETAQVPVIYEPRAARSLLGHLAAAINGGAVARGTTFLSGRLGAPIFAPGVRIIDDPLRRRGLRSRPVDAEGLPVRPLAVIDDGRLTSWLLDLRSARQLNLTSTGHAARSVASPPSPSPSNFYLQGGSSSADALIGSVARGLYITDLMGFGVNGVTGDYSRGASGYWIDNGRLVYPVSEITVSGNLLEMFAHLTAADDLQFRYGMDAPTVRIDGMTVAGR